MINGCDREGQGMALPVVIGELPPGDVTAPIRQSIERQLQLLVPEGKRGALMGVVDASGNARFGVAARIGDGWQLAADVEKRWGGPVSGQVLLTGAW